MSAANENDQVIERFNKTQLGFWLYIMSDLMLFAAFFATYMVLRPGTNGGPDSQQLFDQNYALVETVLLLTSSVTCGIAYINARFNKKTAALWWMLATIGLGASFIGMEITEFVEFAMAGHGPTHSAFLSAFFALVGLHGLHITIGLAWAITLLVYLLRRGLNQHAHRRMMLFTLFWHFLDIVWIFIFSVVYLLGGIS